MLAYRMKPKKPSPKKRKPPLKRKAEPVKPPAKFAKRHNLPSPVTTDDEGSKEELDIVSTEKKDEDDDKGVDVAIEKNDGKEEAPVDDGDGKEEAPEEGEGTVVVPASSPGTVVTVPEYSVAELSAMMKETQETMKKLIEDNKTLRQQRGPGRAASRGWMADESLKDFVEDKSPPM